MLKSSKRFLTTVLLVILSLSLFAACSNDSDSSEKGSSDNSEDVYNIRFSIVGTEHHPMSLSLFELEDELNEMSDGRLEIDFFPNGQLYPDERETNEAIQLGNVEMSVSTTASLSSFHEDLMVLDLPYLFESREKAYKALDGEFGDRVLAGLEDLNMKPLGFQENGFRHLINDKREIKSPEDLKGLKIRVLPSIVYQDSINELGADGSPLAFGELYSALQQGTYDGMESTVDLLYENKFYEVQEYVTLSNTFYAPNVAIINKDFFDALPEDLQEVLVEWTDKFNQRSREIMTEKESEYITMLKEEMEVTELSESEMKVFKEAVEPIYEKYKKELGEDLVEAAIEAAK